MLLPDKTVLASLLRRYRVWEHLVLTKPHDPARRRGLDDVAYTLCVLMGCRTVREAVIAAETYLDTAPASTGSSTAPSTAPSTASPRPPAKRSGHG